MTSLFVEQGAAMENDLAGFKVPSSSMSAFEIISAADFIHIHRRLVDPIVATVRKVQRRDDGDRADGHRPGHRRHVDGGRRHRREFPDGQTFK
ncbi:protein nrt1/ ptr family 7.3 [Phtheirospermum japonicum]|uniref:Protein nrt1/ ptr family 7.3 n=1 Tax=Phtheirospermum japonicum TaxID=374723 RepID=A0A830CA19_9LAMI|nr:protein nrt1/ ptr family 7.3 [Phtheirospermum japonicum]